MADFERFYKKVSNKQDSQQNAPKNSPSHPEVAPDEGLPGKEKGEEHHPHHTSSFGSSDPPPEGAALTSITRLMRKEKKRRPHFDDSAGTSEVHDFDVTSTVLLNRELSPNSEMPASALDAVSLLLAKQAVREF